MRSAIILTAAGLLILSVCSSHATTLRVGGVSGDYSTIQQAVIAAGTGDTVLVAPGAYSAWSASVDYFPYWGRIWITKPLTLVSEQGPDATAIIGSPDSDCCVRVELEASGAITIEGFTIDGGDAAGTTRGVSDQRGNPGIIRDCLFESCADAVTLHNTSSYEITDCLFTENQNGVNSYALPGVPSTVHDCVFIGTWGIPIEGRGTTNAHDNYIEGGYAGIAFEGGTIERNLVRSCTWGIRVSGEIPGHIMHNTVVDCETGVHGWHQITPTSFHGNLVALNNVGVCDTEFTGGYSCNNVWGNATDYQSASPSEDGFADCDPLFCDPDEGDYYLFSESPCGPDGSCGQIGVYGIGCSASAANSTSWGRLKSMYR